MDKIKEEIILLCSNLFGETKAEVKRNNTSIDKLMEIFETVKSQEDYAQHLYLSLLDYFDDKVRFEAATCCLKLKKNIKEAEKVLKNISKTNQNPMIRFSAEMVLDTWKEKKEL